MVAQSTKLGASAVPVWHQTPPPPPPRKVHWFLVQGRSLETFLYESGVSELRVPEKSKQNQTNKRKQATDFWCLMAQMKYSHSKKGGIGT